MRIGLAAEVDSDGARLDADHASDAVGVVADRVVHREGLDGLLGLCLEGTAGEVAARWSGHRSQYAPPPAGVA